TSSWLCDGLCDAGSVAVAAQRGTFLAGVHTLARVGAATYSHRGMHGDIKPGNILVGNQGLRLFDFGLGRSLGDVLPRLDPERFQAWTPRYAAPEVLDGEPVSCASD